MLTFKRHLVEICGGFDFAVETATEMEKAYKIAQMNILAQKIAQKTRISRHISIRDNSVNSLEINQVAEFYFT